MDLQWSSRVIWAAEDILRSPVFSTFFFGGAHVRQLFDGPAIGAVWQMAAQDMCIQHVSRYTSLVFAAALANCLFCASSRDWIVLVARFTEFQDCDPWQCLAYQPDICRKSYMIFEYFIYFNFEVAALVSVLYVIWAQANVRIVAWCLLG